MVCARHALILIGLVVLFFSAATLGQAQTPKIQIHTGVAPQEALFNSILQDFEKSEREGYDLVLLDEQSEANPPFEATGMSGGELPGRAFFPHAIPPLPLVPLWDSRTGKSEPSINAGGLVVDRLRALQQALRDAQQPLTILEGNSKPFEVDLDSQPSGTVTVTITGHANTDLEVSPTQLTFDDTNWDVRRTVTVKVKQDTDDTDENVKLMLTYSGNSITNPRNEDIHITILDDDRPLELAPWRTNEGGSGGRTIPLLRALAPPSDNVIFTITGHENTDLILNQTTLTFPIDADAWQNNQEVRFTSKLDDDNVDDHLTLTFTASGGGYTGLQYTVDVTISDQSPWEILVPEGGDLEYRIRLYGFRPKTDPILTHSGHENTDLTANPEQYTYNKETWSLCLSALRFCSEPQLITYTAGQDSDDVDDQFTFILKVTGPPRK